MSPERTQYIRDKLDNIVIMVIVRLVMPALVTCLLGISSWVGIRAIGLLDAHSDQLQKLERSVGEFKQYLNLVTRQRDGEITDIHSTLTDHETRIRVLERDQPHRK